MALAAYLIQTRSLLQLPGSDSTSLYTDADLTRWINSARGQLAGDSESVRLQATLPTVNGTQVYAFSAFNTGTSSVNGIQGVFNARMILRGVIGGNVMLNAWPWEWFNQYYNTLVSVGAPTDWAQYGQGAGGSIYLSPVPTTVYTLTIDTVCYPIPLVDDTTVEAIPYPWTDCVPYFAAYLALLSAQMGARSADAIDKFKMYEEFKQRARMYSTPTVLPYQYEQSGTRVPIPAGGVAGITPKGAQ